MYLTGLPVISSFKNFSFALSFFKSSKGKLSIWYCVIPVKIDISLSFNFIGGSGLAGPIERLQNAISFNYFGNTEIYDERAVPTEDTSKIDKELEKSILDGETPVTTNNIPNQQQNNGGSTIGDIITNIPSGSGQTGEIAYQKVMDRLYDNTSDYFNTIVNQIEKIDSIGNYGITRLINQSISIDSNTQKIYTDQETDVKIYGNPSGYQKLFDELFTYVNSTIDDGTNPFIQDFNNDYGNSCTPQDKNTLKNNLKLYITNSKNNFISKFATTTQELQTYQQTFYQSLREVSVVCQKVDGKLLSGNIPRVYSLSGLSSVSTTSVGQYTNTLSELQGDFSKFRTTMSEYNDLLSKNGITNSNIYGYLNGDYGTLPGSFLISGNKSDKCFYMVISRDLNNSDTLLSVENALIKGLESNDKLVRRIKKTIEKIADRYDKEIKNDEKYFTKFKKNKEYLDYINGLDEKMYVKGKTRKMNYDTNINSNTQTNGELIKQLYLEPFRFK